MKMHFEFFNNAGLCPGDISDVMLGAVGANGSKQKMVVVKLARFPKDNDLMRNEAATLRTLRVKLPKIWSYCVPKVYDSFSVKTLMTPQPVVNVLEMFPGYLDCTAIRMLSLGVDGRTIAWMWKRLLLLLDWIHRQGIIHGAVLPPHVMYFPDGSTMDERTHAVRLVDFCYSVHYATCRKLAAWVPQYEEFYPPEVFEKQPLGPWTDLYMAAKTMLYLLGGDPKTNRFPDGIPGRIIMSLRDCLNPDVRRRPQAVEHFHRFVKDLELIYGKPKLHEFQLPI